MMFISLSRFGISNILKPRDLGGSEMPLEWRKKYTSEDFYDFTETILKSHILLNGESTPNPTDRFYEDLGVDSIDHVELIMRAEEQFDISIDDARVDHNITVSDFAKLIEQEYKK
jgi:acyl carrier protein